MPYRKVFFGKDQLFHIISRAVDEKRIFANEKDCYRFMLQVYIANIGRPEHNLWRKDIVRLAQILLNGDDLSSEFVIKEHEPFVNILDFSLVATHYHVYLASNIEGGVPLFMHNLNLGFARYFNIKYKRSGSLFGSPYKSIPVKTEAQAHVISNYVSIVNPIDIYQPGWRKNGLKDWKKVFEFLENYQFSSFPDKIGKRRSKILAPEKTLKRYMSDEEAENKDAYRQFVNDFLKQKLESFKPLLLE